MPTAAERGHVEILELFLKHPKIKDKNPKDLNGMSPMHYAAYEGHVKVVELLLRNDQVNKNPKTNTDLSPMHLAATDIVDKGHVDVIKILLAHDQVGCVIMPKVFEIF